MELVIFSNKFCILAIAVILAVYLISAVLKLLFDSKIISVMLIAMTVISMLAHVFLFAMCMYLRATAQEVFFVLTASTAISFAVTKVQKKKEEE